MNTENFNENRNAINQNNLNIRYGCRRILVVYLSMLHRSKNTSSFRYQSFLYRKFVIDPSSRLLNCWQETKREQKLIFAVGAIQQIQTLASFYSSSWDFIIFMGSPFSPSICIDYSISLCWSPFFPWLPCNHWVSLLPFPFIFSSRCQVLIYVFPFFPDVNTDARVCPSFSA